jgi:hypothetical protein
MVVLALSEQLPPLRTGNVNGERERCIGAIVSYFNQSGHRQSLRCCQRLVSAICAGSGYVVNVYSYHGLVIAAMRRARRRNSESELRAVLGFTKLAKPQMPQHGETVKLLIYILCFPLYVYKREKVVRSMCRQAV